MQDCNLKPNQKILEAMLNNAFYRYNFPLLSLICESYPAYNLPVNKRFLERIEKFLSDIRSKILAMVCMIYIQFSFVLWIFTYLGTCQCR
jgi:hypothetical protein